MRRMGEGYLFKIQLNNAGNNSIIQDFSKRVSKNRYDSISVFSQVEKLLSELHQNGFIAASIGQIEFIDSLAKVSIETGAKYQWGKLSFQEIDQKILRKRDLQIIGESETILRPERTVQAFGKILKAYEDNGYPFARISFENVSFEENRVDAEIRVKPYNKIKIDSIVVRGDIRIHRKFIYRQTGILPGSLYNQKKIRNLDRTLNNLPYMTFAREPGVEFRPSGADLYLFLNRQKANRFQGMLGFLSDHKQSGKLVLTGDVQLALMNSFGRGEAWILTGRRPM
jgi:outer membrane protein assembly factor BamA